MIDLLNTLFGPDATAAISAVVVILLALAYLVQAVVQALKVNGKINDGDAGKINLVVSYVVIFLTFLAVQVFGQSQETLNTAQEWAANIAGLIFAPWLLALLSKLFYVVSKFIGVSASKTELSAKG